ncbi:MAG TPA: hypothetical protein VGE12_07530 [Noviherbaspirillum sp.]
MRHVASDTRQTEHAGIAATHARQDRTEPSWDASRIAWATDPLCAGYPSSAYQQAYPAPKRKWPRFMLMAGIFIVGAGAGLIGAWWVDQSPSMSFFGMPARSTSAPVVTVRKTVESRATGKVKGISPSELPYDGAAPPDRAGRNVAEAAAAIPKAGTPKVAMPKTATPKTATPKAEAPKAEAPTPKAGADMPLATAPLVEKTPDTLQPVESSGGSAEALAKEAASGIDAPSGSLTAEDNGRSTDSASVNDTAEPATEKPAPRTAASIPKAKDKSARETRDAESRKASTPSQRPAQQKTAKDREIERIRQQAEDELKKKSESGRLIGRSPGSRATVAKSPSRQKDAARVRAASSIERRVKATLARCERAPNFIRREQCKWKVCGDSWGRNGCPYYPPQVSSNY